MSNREFPVLIQKYGREREEFAKLDCPSTVPWSLLAPHELQALRNHDQSLERLASRGGLAPCEMVAVIEDRRWRRMSDAEAVARLKEMIARTASPAAQQAGGKAK